MTTPAQPLADQQMSPSQFAQSVRSKYPGKYDSLSDYELTSRVLEKYPQYSAHVQNAGQLDEIEVTHPNGQVGTNPASQVEDALGQGYKLNKHVVMYDKDGRKGLVPKEQLNDAVKAGYQVNPETPFEKERRPENQQGGWGHFMDAAKSFGNGLANFNPFASPGEIASNAVERGKQFVADDIARQDEGRSKTYRIAAPIAETLVPGLRTRPMERAADTGDTAGVWGEAAAPAALAVGSAYGPKMFGAAKQAVGSGLTTAKPALSGLADLAEHPLQAPGRLMRRVVDAIPDKPTYPGASLPDSGEFYEQRARDFMRRGREQAALDRQARGQKSGGASSLPKPNGSLVLTPEQFAQAQQAFKIAQQKARENGMYYAGGMRPPGSGDRGQW